MEPVKRERVEIVWEDTASKHGWQKPSEMTTPCKVTTLGYIVHRDRKHITVTEAIDDSDDRDEAMYGCTTAIPRSCIQKVTRLGPRRK